MFRARHTLRLLGPATFASLLLVEPAHAQTQTPPLAVSSVDSRFQPWLGCWRPVDTGIGLEELDGDRQPTRACIVPSATTAGSVDVVLFHRDSLLSRTAVPLPGAIVPRVLDECEGSETAEWTDDNARLVLKAELGCARGIKRVETGLMAMNEAGQWVQFQHLAVGKNEATTVARFRFEGDSAMPAGLQVGALRSTRALRVATGAPVAIDNVIGTANRVPASLAEAWLSELGQRIALDAKTLVRLADAGVSPRVIDVMVALANPERYQIGPAMTNDRGISQGPGIAALRAPRGATGAMRSRCDYFDDLCYGPGGMGAWGLGYRYGMFDPWGYGFYSPYRYGLGAGWGAGWNRFSPWGGLGWGGGWGPGVFYGGGPVVIIPSGAGAGDMTEPVRGRAVRGGGYTRSGAAGSAAGGAAGTSYPAPSVDRMRGSGSGGSGGGASGSSGGASGGAGGTRTAKPRGSGGL